MTAPHAVRQPYPPVWAARTPRHLVLGLPIEVDDRAVADRARQARIDVPALSSFCIARTDRRGLVAGYGAVHRAAIGPAISLLATIVRAQSRH